MLPLPLLITAFLASFAIAAPSSSTSLDTCTTKKAISSTRTSSGISSSANTISGISSKSRHSSNVRSSKTSHSSSAKSSKAPYSSNVKSSKAPHSSNVKSSKSHSSGVKSSKIPHSSGVKASTGVKASQSSHSSGIGPSVTTPSSAVESFTLSSASSTSSVESSLSTLSSSSSLEVTSVSGCPPITISTSISRSFYTSYTSTITTYYSPVAYTSITSYSATTTTVYAATVTANVSTVTKTSLIVASDASTTVVTVPTQPGFTPILCEPTYFESTDYQTFTYFPNMPSVVALTDQTGTTTTLTDFSLIFSTTITSSRSDTLTQTKTATVTVTTTRTANPTSSVYDACQTNNITPRLPNGANGHGGNVYLIGSLVPDVSGTVNSTGIRTLALDPVDCCALCQANSTCTSSAWDVRSNDSYACILFIKTRDLQTCNPTYKAAIGQVGVSDGPYFYMSNAPCGQWELYP